MFIILYSSLLLTLAYLRYKQILKTNRIRHDIKESSKEVNELSKRLEESLIKAKEKQAKQWIDTLTITEELSKPGRPDGPTTIFYIREKPFKAGFSYQSTALTEDVAKWVITQLKKDYNLI